MRDTDNTNSATRQNHYPLRLGIIGGGQLARMTAMAAAPLGCQVIVLEKSPKSPAAKLAPDSLVGDWNDPKVLLEFAKECDLLTLENEFVDANALAELEKAGHILHPGADCLALTQDKFIQKQTMQKAGLPVPAFRAVATQEEIRTAGREAGWPMVLKTRRNGYDGKGNFTLRSEADIETGWSQLRGDKNQLMVEAFYPFVKELAVMVTRSRDGQSVVYPVVETIQKNHVCHLVKAPAPVPETVRTTATQIARRAIDAINGVGSFGVEMFMAANGEIVINELAPRVHNSGHYSIEACDCSQFENHVRAVLGWPLISPRMVAPAAVMINLLGTQSASGRPVGLENALKCQGARIHIYGKPTSSAGRKMGHITALGENLEVAQTIAEDAARQITFSDKP